METDIATAIEQTFSTLPPGEREVIIRWAQTAGRLDADIVALEGIAQHGLRWEEPHVGG